MSVKQEHIDAVETWLRTLHDGLTEGIEQLDGGARFRRDTWARPEGGGGDSRVLEDGALFEKGGVNFSLVHGERLPPTASARRPELAGRGFKASPEEMDGVPVGEGVAGTALAAEAAPTKIPHCRSGTPSLSAAVAVFMSVSFSVYDHFRLPSQSNSSIRPDAPPALIVLDVSGNRAARSRSPLSIPSIAFAASSIK